MSELKVLIADSEPNDNNEIQAVLASLGHHNCVAINSGADLFATISKNSPDLLHT